MKEFVLVRNYLVWMFILNELVVGALCLRNVRISMPNAVEKDQKVYFNCSYDLEGEILYTLKWYKGETQEFFRYTPREKPNIKIFPVRGYPELKILEEESNGNTVVIEKAHVSLSGRYICEVTTDAPSFHAVSAHGELRVVVLPKEYPQITGNKPKVKEGKWVNLTCTSTKSIPAANLTWIINNQAITDKYRIQNTRRVIDANDLEEAESRLSFVVTKSHFVDNSLKIRCTASLYFVYQKASEISILQDRPSNKVEIYQPERQRDPTIYAIPTSNVKYSRTNLNGFDRNNDNNGEPFNRNSATAVSSTSIALVVMTRLLR